MFATRFVKCLLGLYSGRLREFQLPSVQKRILRTMLIMVYNAFQGNLNLPLEALFRCASGKPPSWASIQGPAASIQTRLTRTIIRSSSGRAVGQTTTLRRGSATAKCGQGAARQLLGEHFPGSCLTPRNFIYHCTCFRHQLIEKEHMKTISIWENHCILHDRLLRILEDMGEDIVDLI